MPIPSWVPATFTLDADRSGLALAATTRVNSGILCCVTVTSHYTSTGTCELFWWLVARQPQRPPNRSMDCCNKVSSGCSSMGSVAVMPSRPTVIVTGKPTA